MNSQNLMFQSNRNIDILPQVLNNHASGDYPYVFDNQNMLSTVTIPNQGNNGSLFDLKSPMSQTIEEHGDDSQEWVPAKQDRSRNLKDSKTINDSALLSTSDYHSQYNRLEAILKFNLPVVTKQHIFNPQRSDNERLNEIKEKLKDPEGHLLLMERNAMMKKKWNRNSSLDRTRGKSFATIQE